MMYKVYGIKPDGREIEKASFDPSDHFYHDLFDAIAKNKNAYESHQLRHYDYWNGDLLNVYEIRSLPVVRGKVVKRK